MANDSPILKALAARYGDSQAGRSGQYSADFTADYRDVLITANCADGEALTRAENDVRAAVHESGGLFSLDTHPRDARIIHRLRLAQEGGEAWLFSHIGKISPTEQRRQISVVFEMAAQIKIVPHWQNQWSLWCGKLAQQALTGQTLAPFSREDTSGNEELLSVFAGVLAWQGESMIRFASCVLCGNSKRLGQLRAKVETCAFQLSHGKISTLEELGLVETPRHVLMHGPLKIEMESGVLDFGVLHGPVRISEIDLRKALSLTTSATRCLTVENETTFHELAKLNSNTLIIQTSYPGRAVLEMLHRLPSNLECWHFGDSDPAGFDILRDLRTRSRRPIGSLHMIFRPSACSEFFSASEKSLLSKLLDDPLMADVHNELKKMLSSGRKGSYEQESMGAPTMKAWPFYQEESD